MSKFRGHFWWEPPDERDWGATCVVQEFLADNPNAHPLFQPASTPFGGLSVWHPDWMHTKCLGTDASLLGSVLMFLIQEVMPETAEGNLATIWQSVQLFYRAHKTRNRLGRLTINMVKHEPFPRLAAKGHRNSQLDPSRGRFFESLGW